MCRLGNLNQPSKFVVLGDSHAESLQPGFDMAGKSLNIAIDKIALAGCPPLLGVDVIKGSYSIGVCRKVADLQYEYVLKNNIKEIILVSRWTQYTDGDYDGTGMGILGLNKDAERSKRASRKVFEEGFDKTVKAYQAIGVKVYVLAQVPQQKINVKNLYIKLHLFSPQALDKKSYINEKSVKQEDHELLQSYTRNFFAKYVNKNDIKLISLDDAFCKAGTCLMGEEDKAFYKDTNHLSEIGAIVAAPELIRQLN